MFVASRVYNYATGASSVAPDPESTPANTRLKRHPRRQPHIAHAPQTYSSAASSSASVDQDETQASTSIASNGTLNSRPSGGQERSSAEVAKIKVIDEIVRLEDLYDILDVKRNAKSEDIRRGFLNRSRVCHPDKLPNYAPCVVAFQKVSFAYQTLSKPSSRRMYDVSGRSDLAAALNENAGAGTDFDASGTTSDETLNSVLYSVFCEFLEGDFEMLRVLVNAMNEGNPGLNIGEDAVDSIEGAFRRLRELMFAGKKYLSIVRFELIRLYEIQHSLRQLSYFDVFGRLRLTLQLARVTLSIPMAIDQAMKEPDEADDAMQQQEGVHTATGNAATTKEDSQSSESSDSESDDCCSAHSKSEQKHQTMHHRQERRRRRRLERQRKASTEDFGMRAEEEDELDGFNDDEQELGLRATDEPPSLFGSTVYAEQQTRQSARKARRRTRIKAHQRAKLESQEAQGLQPRGLLGPTASGLLKGVVKVLETSENWVPGGGKGTSINA